MEREARLIEQLEADPGGAPPAEAEKLRLAAEAFREYYAECFWYWRKDLRIGMEDLPEIARGLRRYGGKRGFSLASRLCP